MCDCEQLESYLDAYLYLRKIFEASKIFASNSDGKFLRAIFLANAESSQIKMLNPMGVLFFYTGN